MPNSVYKSKEKMRSRLKKRLAILEKKFNSDPDNVDAKMLQETNQIDDLLKLLDEPESIDQKSKNVVPIRENAEESWYRSLAGYWFGQHSETGVNPTQQSTIYKYILRFFVDQVVMNPENFGMSYPALLNKMEHLNSDDGQLKDISRDLEDIKKVISFIAAMEHERNTLPEGMQQFTPEMFEELHSEINPSGPLGIALRQFERNRMEDKVKAKQRGNGGMEF